MDEEHTRQTLDALGDLFLTNSVPGTPVAPKSDESDHGSRPPVDDDSPVPMRLVPKVAHGPEMNTHDTSVAATPDPTMTLRYHGEDQTDSASAQTLHGDHSPQLAMHVEVVMLGNLPVLSKPWLSQYAHQLATDRGPVAVMHVDVARIDLELISTTDRPACIGPAGSVTTAAPDQAAPPLPVLLKNLIEAEPEPVRTWLVHLPRSQSATQMARALPLRRWTLLSGGDDAAVAAAQQQLKQILETDESPEHRQVGLAMMGSDKHASLSVTAKLNEIVGRLLHAPIELKCTLKQMLPVRQHVLGSFSDAQSLWPQILNFFQRTAGPELISTARRAADRDIPRATAQAAEPCLPVHGTASLPSPRSPESHPVPTAIQAEPDLRQLLGTAIPGSILLEASCPHQQDTLLALDQHGTVHLLLHKAGRSSEAVRAALVDLITTRNWVTQHLGLLQLTQRQCQFDAKAEPVLHLFTDQAKTAAALLSHLGSEVRLHLLQRIAIGEHANWYCTDMN